MEGLFRPFKLRTAFSRDSFAQPLLFEGVPPAAAVRLEHDDEAIRRAALTRGATVPQIRLLPR